MDDALHMTLSFEVYCLGEDGLGEVWRWRLDKPDGQTIAISCEEYPSRDTCMADVRLVMGTSIRTRVHEMVTPLADRMVCSGARADVAPSAAQAQSAL